jgi:hypothetical protein
MTWIFVMFLNGWTIDVDSFAIQSMCEEKVRQYNAAAKQSGSQYLVWCTARPRA